MICLSGLGSCGTVLAVDGVFVSVRCVRYVVDRG